MKNVKQSAPPPEFVVEAMGEYVEKYITAINFIPRGDDRDPPGDHWGTGWLVEECNRPIIATCEHVAIKQLQGILGYSCSGSEYGVSVGGEFSLYPFELDFAHADISKTFNMVGHKGECTTKEHYADSHSPVADEYLYVYGFPGADAQVGFGQHEIRGMGVFLREVQFDPSAFTEAPVPVLGKHISCAWSTNLATPLMGTSGSLSLPNGMSGSPLWNTRYTEVTNAGGIWTPCDSRITGIVWGHSAKMTRLFATPVESFKKLLFM